VTASDNIRDEINDSETRGFNTAYPPLHLLIEFYAGLIFSVNAGFERT
jgi:hypothetical protein